jgi:hypothetical protein
VVLGQPVPPITEPFRVAGEVERVAEASGIAAGDDRREVENETGS